MKYILLILLTSCTRYYTVTPATIVISRGLMKVVPTGAARIIKDTVIHNSFIINKH